MPRQRTDQGIRRPLENVAAVNEDQSRDATQGAEVDARFFEQEGNRRIELPNEDAVNDSLTGLGVSGLREGLHEMNRTCGGMAHKDILR